MKNKILVGIAGLVLVFGGVCHAQNPPSKAVVMSEVVKLSQAHQSDDVIIGYLRNSGASFPLTADEIIYLNNQGVSQHVIGALQAPSGGGPISTAPIAPPPGTVPPSSYVPPPGGVPPSGAVPPAGPEGTPDFNTFHDQLASDGSWVDVPGDGPCWRPAILTSNPDWRPYYDGGHWVYTDDGWYWQSDYPWGGVVFHYGRWRLNPHYGWVWVPGYNWGPSWVSWRYGGGYMGWAPLPPEARFEVGVGLTFHGRVGVDLDFGLGAGLFTFVGYDHFWEHDFHHWIVPHDRIDFVFRGTRLSNDFRMVNGHFVNEGIGRDRVGALTHHEVVVEHGFGRDRFGFDRGRAGFDRGRAGFGHDDRGRDIGHDDRGGHDEHGGGRGFEKP
jgi:hypothetical protein